MAKKCNKKLAEAQEKIENLEREIHAIAASRNELTEKCQKLEHKVLVAEKKAARAEKEASESVSHWTHKKALDASLEAKKETEKFKALFFQAREDWKELLLVVDKDLREHRAKQEA